MLHSSGCSPDGCCLSAAGTGVAAAARKLEKKYRKRADRGHRECIFEIWNGKGIALLSQKNLQVWVHRNKVNLVPAYLNILGKVSDPEAVKKGVDMVKGLGLKYKQYGIKQLCGKFPETS